MYFFDGVDDAADHFFRIGRTEGAVGTVDSGLDNGISIFDRFDEGRVRCGVALGDAKTGMVAQLGRKLCRVTEQGCDVVLLAKACCKGGRADPT